LPIVTDRRENTMLKAVDLCLCAEAKPDVGPTLVASIIEERHDRRHQGHDLGTILSRLRKSCAGLDEAKVPAVVGTDIPHDEVCSLKVRET